MFLIPPPPQLAFKDALVKQRRSGSLVSWLALKSCGCTEPHLLTGDKQEDPENVENIP